MTRGGTGAPGREPAVQLALFALALAVRALGAPGVFVGATVQPIGNDAFYHLRRIAYTLANFPASLEFDRYLHHPDGARPIWTPVFDWVLAAALRPFVSAQDLDAMERWAMWAPPLLGAVTVVVVYRLGRRHFGRAVGALAGALLAVLPGHTWYSQVGFVDHHVAVGLTASLCLAAGMAFLQPGAVPLRRSLALGGSLALALLVWPGSLLHVAVVELACLAAAALARGRDEARDRMRALAWANAMALVAVLPLAWDADWPQWSAASPVVLSRFQPWLFAALAALALGAAVAWPRTALGASRGARLASAAAGGAVLLAASVLALPELAGGLGDAWRWLARQDRFQALVAESQPLFAGDDGVTLRIAFDRLTPFFLLVPVALLALARDARRRGDAALALCVAWSAAVCLAAVAQRRFFHSASIAVALLLAWSVWRLGRGRGLRARAALATALLLLLVPSFQGYALETRNALRALAGVPIEASLRRTRHATALWMARWLRANTPPTAGWLDAAQSPEYGVLAPWTLGHVIQYVGRRPTVVDNFGDDLGADHFELAQRYYESSEPEAAALLERLRVRYVIAARGPVAGTAPGSMQRALAQRYGSERPPADSAAGAALPALVRHRLVYESRARLPRETEAPGLFTVYELVRGARVSGRAAPGARIEVRLDLRTNRKRPLAYRTSARAGADGRYAVRVPYATQGAPPAVRVAPAYVFACGEQRARLPVAEADVQSGAELAGPDLCMPAAGQ